MKKITTLLVFVPIFLITALNFTGGNTVDEHPPYMKAFTCSSCHATIIDNIIINGKNIKNNSALEVTLILPNDVTFNAIQVDVIGIDNPKESNFPVYQEDDYGTIYNTSIDKDLNGKKANEIVFEIPMSEFVEGEDIQIQGLLTNADGSSKGDYSFSEKIVLEQKSSIEEAQPLSIFPSVANTHFTIKNAELNSMVTIVDLSGRKVFQNTISSTEELIDVSNFQNGYYFVQTTNSTSKIIVRK